MKFASRLQGVDESATFKYSNLTRERKAINFTIGRTNFETPAAITEATKKALTDGKIHYTPTEGIPELRKAIAEKLVSENGINGLSAGNVLVSAGAKHIIYEAVMAIVERGDVVAMSDPSWVSYESIVKLAEGKVAWLPLTAEEGFIPGEAYFSALENAKPKLILLNSPNNPTGAVYPEKVIRKIVDIAQRKDAILLSDEIYERLIYDGAHFSAGSIYDNTITVNGFSKEYSMTGWRLGYAASKNQELINKMNLIQAQTVSCAVSFIQYGALAAYTAPVKKEVASMVAELKGRRDYLIKRLEKTPAVLKKPAGAFYIFPYFAGEDDIKLADKLMDAGVGVIPGSPFGSVGRGCVRMSYGAVSMKELAAAADILEDVL